MSVPAEVQVIVPHGGFLRRCACDLGLHSNLVLEVEGDRLTPGSLRYCRWCGSSTDTRWEWSESVHELTFSTVKYHPRWKAA